MKLYVSILVVCIVNLFFFFDQSGNDTMSEDTKTNAHQVNLITMPRKFTEHLCTTYGNTGQIFRPH